MIKFFKKCYNHLIWIIKKTKNDLAIKKIKNSTPKYGLNKNSQRNNSIVISLTSYSERFSTLSLCLKSLLRQTVKPDKIVLYLTEQDSLNITKSIKKLKQFGIEINAVEDDLKPHKKYFYAMQDYPDAILITVDDDVIYDKNLVKRLVSVHNKYPNAIVADRARIINFNENGFLPYRSWKLANGISKPSLKLLATGVGGVLYPSHVFNFDLLLNTKYIMKYISVDDLWLKTVEILNNIPTVTSINNCYCPPYVEIPSSSQKKALSKTNVDKNENDKYWMQLDKKFNLFSKLTNN